MHTPSTRPHRQFLFDALDRGLQRSGAASGLVLYSLDRLQQGRHVGHHHLTRETKTKKNTKKNETNLIKFTSTFQSNGDEH